MKSTDETWADPKFQQECAEMQEKVQKLRAELNSEVKELCRGTPLPPGYFRDEHGRTHKMSYVLTKDTPPLGANTDYCHIDDGEPKKISFCRRLYQALKETLIDQAVPTLIVAVFAGVALMIQFPILAEVAKGLVVLAVMLAAALFALWFIKIWTWDILRKTFKK